MTDFADIPTDIPMTATIQAKPVKVISLGRADVMYALVQCFGAKLPKPRPTIHTLKTAAQFAKLTSPTYSGYVDFLMGVYGEYSLLDIVPGLAYVFCSALQFEDFPWVIRICMFVCGLVLSIWWGKLCYLMLQSFMYVACLQNYL